VIPVSKSTLEDEEMLAVDVKDGKEEEGKTKTSTSLTQVTPVSKSTLEDVEMHEKEVDKLHKEHEEHDKRLKIKHANLRRKSTIRVKERILARTAIRHSKTLQKTTIFQHLSSDAISKIIDVMEYRSFDTGENLVVQGDLGTEFMVIVKGAVNILQDQQVVNTLGGLDCLGEGALVRDDHYRGATVVATALTQVLILSYERYQELLLDGTIAKTTHEALEKLSASYTAPRERIKATLNKTKLEIERSTIKKT